jgi:hypothetical protein
MANTKIDANQIEWTPAASNDAALYFAGPSFNGIIQQGDDAAAQIFGTGMSSALYLGANHKFNFSLKIGADTAYNSSAMAPKAYIDNNGKVTIKGTGSVGPSSLTTSYFIAGNPDGQTFYLVLDVKNNTGATVNVIPTLISSSGNLQNFRGDVIGHYGDVDTDVISWDNTNKYIQITTPAVSNIFMGMRACNTTQGYLAQTAFVDINGTYLGAGDLPNSIGALGTSNYVFIENGLAASPTPITAGATVRFAWVVAFRTTQAALQTAMAALTSVPTSNITTSDGYFTATRMSVQTNTKAIDTLYLRSQGIMNALANTQIINAHTAVAAGSYTFTFPFARDGYYSSKTLNQITGGPTITADDYALFKLKANGNNSQQHEVAQYVNASGLFVAAGNNGTPGDQDFYQILKAYDYYVTTLDATFLAAEITNLNNIGTYLNTFYTGNTSYKGLFASNAVANYPDGANNFTGATYIHEPIVSSQAIYTFQRLAELNTAAGNTSQATTWNAVATAMARSISEFWNASSGWPYVNIKQDGTKFTSRHLTSVDLALWDVGLPLANAQAMATQLTDGATWWDSANYMFREMPTTDPNYNAGSYWLGPGWHLTDFKAIELVLRYGTPTQAKTVWAYLQQIANDRANNIRGWMAEHYNNSGMFGFSVGALHELLVRGLFGIDVHTTYFTITPNTYKIGGGTFTLTNIKMGNQTYSISVSGMGPVQKTYVNGVLQSSNRITYSANTTVVVTFSGRGKV